MKAVVGDTVIAEAPQEDLIQIEGNWYFPPSSVKPEFFSESDTQYHCPWKGDTQYYTVTVDGQPLPDRAWSYPTPIPSSFDRVARTTRATTPSGRTSGSSTDTRHADPAGGRQHPDGRRQPARVSTTRATLSATITDAMTPATTRVGTALTSVPMMLRRDV